MSCGPDIVGKGTHQLLYHFLDDFGELQPEDDWPVFLGSSLEDPLVRGKPDFAGEQQHAGDFPYESSSSTHSGTSRC